MCTYSNQVGKVCTLCGTPSPRSQEMFVLDVPAPAPIVDVPAPAQVASAPTTPEVKGGSKLSRRKRFPNGAVEPAGVRPPKGAVLPSDELQLTPVTMAKIARSTSSTVGR